MNILTLDGSKVEVPDEVVLLGYRGSIAHNMYIPNIDPNSIDDIDLMGFSIPSIENYLGLTEWGSRGTKEEKKGKFDCVYYELRKAITLLLQGNPNILGMLWLRPGDYLYKGYTGNIIINNRDLFSGKHVYHAFAGYASGQLAKMTSRDPAELRLYMAVDFEMRHRGIHPNFKVGEFGGASRPLTGEAHDVVYWNNDKLKAFWKSYQKKGENIGYLGEKRKELVIQHGYDSKNAAHLIRLLRMCKEFLSEGILKVYRTDDAQELLDIKRGKWKLENIKNLAEELFQECRIAKDKSPLPEGPNKKEIEKLLVRSLWDEFLL